MFDFINSLATSAIIVKFDGEIVERNKWCMFEIETNKFNQLHPDNVKDVIAEDGLFDKIVEKLLNGEVIQNLKILAKCHNNSTMTRINNITLLSREKELILIQVFGDIQFNDQLTEKYLLLLQDLKKLKPHLNKIGQQLLDKIYKASSTEINNDLLDRNLQYFSQNLTHKYQTLTNRELYISSLLAFSFSNSEITKITSYTANALRVNIHRICTKLNLASRDELTSTLKDILAKLPITNNLD
jgi:DNA-binding CsgD family transcriptional regulator